MIMLLLPIAIATLLVLSAMLAASETALFSLTRMEHTREQLDGAVRAAIDRLMARPLESLMVIIGLNEAANVFAECLATTFLIFWLGTFGAYLSVPLMLVTVLIFCDITPKTLSLGLSYAGVANQRTAAGSAREHCPSGGQVVHACAAAAAARTGLGGRIQGAAARRANSKAKSSRRSAN